MIAAPLYRQAADALRTRIGEGRWRQGDRLPSETELCREFGVSSITIRRAVQTLVNEGLLSRLQGKGTFVSSDHSIVQGPPRLTSFTEDMTLRGWTSSARDVSVATVAGKSAIASRLGLPDGAPVTMIHRLRLADEMPVALQVAHLSAMTFAGLDGFDFRRESLYEVLRREYGVNPASATETYAASVATATEAKRLDIKSAAPVFRAERLTIDSTGRRIELVNSVIRGDRYTLALRLSISRQQDR